MPQFTRQTIIRWAAPVLLALVVVYPLSYAPVVKWTESDLMIGPDIPAPADGGQLPGYRPLDWLIDNTPLREPMFAWARVWGVETQFEWASFFREVEADAIRRDLLPRQL